MKLKKKLSSWIFPIVVLVLYLIVFMFSEEKAKAAVSSFLNILIKVIPIFVLVFIIMLLFNYFINPKKLIKRLQTGHGAKKWLFAIVAGILSAGPIYVWYPLLKDLKAHGVESGLIAAFLYNRAIKLPLLPLLILYFSIKFAIILLILMIIFSVIQGYIINMVEK